MISIPIVLQDHPASTDVHMSSDLILRVIHEVPSIACVKEEAVPTAGKIRLDSEAQEILGMERLAPLVAVDKFAADFFGLCASSNGLGNFSDLEECTAELAQSTGEVRPEWNTLAISSKGPRVALLTV